MAGTVNLDKAANITPPVQGRCFAVASAAGSVSYQLPHSFDTSWITIRARGTAGNTAAFNFSVGAGTVAAAPLSAAGPPLVAAVNGGRTIAVGEECSFYLPNVKKEIYEFYHLNIINSTGGCEIEFWASSNPVQ